MGTPLLRFSLGSRKLSVISYQLMGYAHAIAFSYQLMGYAHGY
ncbi:hypothetical protein [Moorena sp. SIO4E2]|nr:hypothetical protein [Moorena sp. SIO4E2]